MFQLGYGLDAAKLPKKTPDPLISGVYEVDKGSRGVGVCF